MILVQNLGPYGRTWSEQRRIELVPAVGRLQDISRHIDTIISKPKRAE
jgi:hypothetical protein